jgi:hypothetical protein
MLKQSRLVVAVVIALVVGPSTASWGWGHEGHRVIARIAAKALDNDTRTKLAAIFGTADTPGAVEAAMADASVWPDQIDKFATGTREWHFINVPVSKPFSVVGLCPLHKCVIDRVNEMEARLRNNQKGFTLLKAPFPNRPMTSREMAFLIHLVGDLHQPLHAATNNDLGGTAVTLTVAIPHGQFPTTNLHGAWDEDEVDAVLTALGDENHAVAALFQRFQNGAAVTQLGPVEWAHESSGLAEQDVYGKLQIANHVVNVTPAYLQGNVGDVEQQLMRAGIRLGRLLKDICQGDGCKANP